MDIRFYVRAKAPRDCGDLYNIGPTLLTTAYYFQQGLSAKEIAQTRGIALGVIYSHKWHLKKITGSNSIGEALEKLAAVIEARSDELGIYSDKDPRRREIG